MYRARSDACGGCFAHALRTRRNATRAFQRCRARSCFECPVLGGSHSCLRQRASSAMELPHRSLRVTIPELRIAHRCNFRTVSISFPRSTKVGAGCAAFGHGHGRRSMIFNRSAGDRLGCSAPSASILELVNPSLYATAEFDGVAKPTPFRSQRFTSAPFVAASRSFDITFAESDHTCTGNRTGKTKSVKHAHTHTRAHGGGAK